LLLSELVVDFDHWSFEFGNWLLFIVWDLLFICDFSPSSDFYNILPRVQYYLWDTIRLVATYYISGPPPMLKVLSRDLSNLGVSPEAIRIDAWE